MKKFAKNPWAIGIGTTVIGGVLLSFVLDWIKGVDWLSTLKIVITFIFNVIVAFLTFELKVWWILIAVALIVVALIIVAKIHNSKPESSFLSYTKDSVLGYTWEWEYKKTYEGKYTICNLHPVCSNCGMRLKQVGVYGGQMDCLRCNASYEWDDSYLSDAQMLIEDNIIKKKYIQDQ